MRNPTGHAAGFAAAARVVAFVVAALVLSGCALAGRVYIAFFWSDSETPDAGFTCTAPNVPPIASIIRGAYYQTVPGQYTLQYGYSGPPPTSWSLSFVLSADTAVLGSESAYYHATLRKTSAPTVAQYP